MNLLSLCLCVLVVGFSEPARFHHVHLNSTDPAAAMDYFVRRFGAVTVILPGLGVGVRSDKSYLLFESVDDPPPAQIQSAAWRIGWGQPSGASAKEGGSPSADRTGPDGLLIETNTANNFFNKVYLLSGDPVAAGEWYVNHLGARPQGTTFAFDNVSLIILPKKERLLPTRGRLIDHLAFSYPSLAPALERLEKEGVKIVERRTKSAFVEGPDGMSIEIVEDPGPERAAYWCPMDPQVRSPMPGKCPVCGMPLVSLDPGEYVQYPMGMQVRPRALRPGQVGRLVFMVNDPHTGVRVLNFETVHEKLFHLFVVSHDLNYFAHIHPTPQKDGTFVIETSFPKPGPYQIYADLFPTGATPQVIQKAFVTAGYQGSLLEARAKLTPDTVLAKTDHGMSAHLRAAEYIPGRKQTLIFTLTDAKTGEPVRDLEQYLAAWGHMLILSEDLSDYVHGHATLETTAEGPPQLSFDVVFPRPGNYRLWAQFQRHGELSTFPFTVAVTRPR